MHIFIVTILVESCAYVGTSPDGDVSNITQSRGPAWHQRATVHTANDW